MPAVEGRPSSCLPSPGWFLFANVYAYGRYEPVQFDYWRAALPMALGGVLLGGGLIAGLDMTMRTHAFVVREYELEYRLDGSAEKRRMLTTPEHLLGFPDRRAVAHVRAGGFGWPWVETLTARSTGR